MRKSLTIRSSILVAGGLTLAACGSGGSDGGGDAADAAADEQITLEVVSATVVESPEGDAERAMAEAFMAENPDVTIEFIGTPMNNLYAQLTTMATGGNVPDIFTNSPEFYAQAQELGIVQPLGDLLGEEFIDGFQPALLEQAVIDGELQFAPFFTIPTGLLYRSDLMEAAGQEPPTTWEEFREVAEALTVDEDGDGTPEQYGFAMVGSNDGSGGSRFLPIMRTFGAAELVEEGDGWTTEFDSPEAVAAFELYGDLVEAGVVPPGPLQTSYGEAISLMSTETAAMMVTGSHSIGAITAQNPELEGKLAAVPLPSAPGEDPVAALGMLGFSISSSSEHQEAAADYIRFILSEENQLEWNDVTGRMPARTDAAEEIRESRPELGGFLDAAEYAFVMPQVPYYANLQVIAAENYQAVITGQKTPEEAAADAAARTQQEIENS